MDQAGTLRSMVRKRGRPGQSVNDGKDVRGEQLRDKGKS